MPASIALAIGFGIAAMSRPSGDHRPVSMMSSADHDECRRPRPESRPATAPMVASSARPGVVQAIEIGMRSRTSSARSPRCPWRCRARRARRRSARPTRRRRQAPGSPPRPSSHSRPARRAGPAPGPGSRSRRGCWPCGIGASIQEGRPRAALQVGTQCPPPPARRAAAPDVDAGEQEQPHHVDEVPVPGGELEAEMLLRREVARIGAEQADDQEDRADDAHGRRGSRSP